MDVFLKPQFESIVRRKVATGSYPTAENVIEEALRLLKARDQTRELRATLIAADEEIERGEGVEWSPALMDDLRRDADEMYNQGERFNPDDLI